MRFATYRLASRHRSQLGLAAADKAGTYRGLLIEHASYPGTLDSVIAKGEAALRAAAETLVRTGEAVDLGVVKLEQPLAARGKIICVGLNYADHASEASMKAPDYPTLFARFPSSLIAHGEPIVRPRVSEKLDYEGELVAVIGKGGRHIPRAAALSHVCGYSIFNDGSIRDFQLRTPQWTVGKNFDNTGPFGPVFVSADELPPGAHGLKIETRLNGRVMQSATTADLIFDGDVGRARQRGDDARAGRSHHHRHAGGRRRRAQAAGLHESRRHLRGRDRRHRNSAQSDCR